MAEIHNFPDVARVEREAADWIARLHADDVVEEDRIRFTAWHAAHPVHARIFDSMSGVWQALDTTGGTPRETAHPPSFTADSGGPDKGRGRWLAAVAASLLAGALYWTLFLSGRAKAPETVFQTGLGERAAVTLPDHSRIEMNSNTRVRVNYSTHTRRIELQRGEAFFTVMSEPSRPFWVVGGGSSIQAVGTAFSVYMRAAGVRITVAQGAVQVGPTPTHPAHSLLRAGQQADMSSGTATLRTLSRAELDRSLAWRSGRLLFERQTLGEVLQELSRYSSVEFVVNDDSLRQLEIGGSFPAGPKSADALAQMLVDGFGLRVRHAPGRIYIEKAASSTAD